MSGQDVVTAAIIDATDGATSAGDLGHASIYETTIGNVPLIRLVCEDIAACGIQMAQIVARPDTRRALGRILGGGEAWGLRVEYVDAADGGRGTVLQELEAALVERPVLLHPGDCLSRDALQEMTRRFAEGDVDAVVPAQTGSESGRPSRRTTRDPLVVGLAARGLVQGLLPASTSSGDLGVVLASGGIRLGHCETRDTWRYDDSTEALLTANRLVLDALHVEAPPDDPVRGVRFHGRVEVAASASISGSVIVGPASIGERAVVEDSHVGPFTAIAQDTIISGADLDNTIVLPGAEIRHPGVRIEGSIVGAGASVIRSFDLPQGMHVRLSAGSSLRLS